MAGERTNTPGPSRPVFRGPKALRHLALERLQLGPQTTDDLLTAFPEYSPRTVATVIAQIRAMGHRVKAVPYKRNRSFTLSYRYELVAAPKAAP